jgi:phosphopantothenoylcysteine decarboxylase/phosphopantothenate--cysteine ligase
MAGAVLQRAGEAQVIVKTAAVGDYAPSDRKTQKINKGDDPLSLTLEKTEDILRALGRQKFDRQILVGFAAETESLEQHATAKLREKNLDMIAGNLLGAPDAGFGSDTNRVTLFFRDGRKEELPVMDKDAVAHVLLDRVKQLLDALA